MSGTQVSECLFIACLHIRPFHQQEGTKEKPEKEQLQAHTLSNILNRKTQYTI